MSKSKKSLSISRETVRELSVGEIKMAAGGVTMAGQACTVIILAEAGAALIAADVAGAVGLAVGALEAGVLGAAAIAGALVSAEAC
jgi:hypothetical protein